jgi:hypothetical protein
VLQVILLFKLWASLSLPLVITLSTRDKEKYNEATSQWKCGEFDALSFVRGNPTITRKIIVNGDDIDATENLEDALRNLQGRLVERNGRRIWIDALCKNQVDIPERNIQIKRMRTVYEQAGTILARLESRIGCR